MDNPVGHEDETQFTIEWVRGVNGHTVAMIRYHDVMLYGGRALLVYLATAPDEVTKQTSISPQFAPRLYDSLQPFARFEPTSIGVSTAMAMCAALGMDEMKAGAGITEDPRWRQANVR